MVAESLFSGSRIRVRLFRLIVTTKSCEPVKGLMLGRAAEEETELVVVYLVMRCSGKQRALSFSLSLVLRETDRPAWNEQSRPRAARGRRVLYLLAGSAAECAILQRLHVCLGSGGGGGSISAEEANVATRLSGHMLLRWSQLSSERR